MCLTLENPTVANIFRSSNPVLKDKVFTGQIAAGEVMTVQGTVNKTGILLLCVVATAAWTWGLAHSEQPEAAFPWMLGGLFGGLITCLVTVFKKECRVSRSNPLRSRSVCFLFCFLRTRPG